jgi:protocatechuate 3,4-dioxygenase beta subunit
MPSTANATTNLPPTPQQVDGPYFLANAPMRTRLIPAGMTGDELAISGRVLATDGTVIADAMVHVWLADPKGVYDNQDATGAVIKIPVSKMTLRGRIKSDANGKYGFECLRPGNYELDAGRWRPAHIHVMVVAKGYKQLITQLYFVDDKYNDKDLPGDLFFQKELLVPMNPATASPGVVQKGTFDFVLEK